MVGIAPGGKKFWWSAAPEMRCSWTPVHVPHDPALREMHAPVSEYVSGTPF